MLFNPMRPVFVKFPQGLNFGGTKYKKSQEVPWVYLGIDEERIKILVQNDILYHSYELEKQNKAKKYLLPFHKMVTISMPLPLLLLVAYPLNIPGVLQLKLTPPYGLNILTLAGNTEN
jgi:hypothetical protein